MYACYSGSAPILPFLSTISMQRGYSSVVVGLIFTVFPIISIVVRPIVGAITDKYKCRKAGLILTSVMNCLLVFLLMFIPGAYVKTDIADADVIKLPTFWLFFGTIALLHTVLTARSVLENTICMGLLGKCSYI